MLSIRNQTGRLFSKVTENKVSTEVKKRELKKPKKERDRKGADVRTSQVTLNLFVDSHIWIYFGTVHELCTFIKNQ